MQTRMAFSSGSRDFFDYKNTARTVSCASRPSASAVDDLDRGVGFETWSTTDAKLTPTTPSPCSS